MKSSVLCPKTFLILMEKMTKWTLVLTTVGLLVSSCAPMQKALPAREALPAAYSSGPAEPGFSGSILWREWVVDPQLRDLFERALDRNLELKYLEQAIGMSDAELMARKGEYLPFVALVANSEGARVGTYTRWGAVEKQIDIVPGEENPEFLRNSQLGLSMQWEVDLWQKLRNRKRSAVKEWLASKEAKHLAQTALLAEITHLYYEICALDLQEQTLQKTIDIQLEALEIVKLLKANGREDALAVLRYEAEVKKNQSILYHLDQRKTEFLATLSVILAEPSGRLKIASSPMLEVSVPLVKTGISSEMLQYRPDIRKAELEMQAVHFEVKAARAAFYPQLVLRAGGGVEAFKQAYLNFSPEALAYSLAGEFLGPLLNRTALKSAYRRANAHQIQVALDYQKTVLNAYGEVVSQLNKQMNMANALAQQEEQVDLLQKGVGISKQLFQSARVDYVEVLMTQREALEAQMEWIETKKEQWFAWVDLYVALGGGWN